MDEGHITHAANLLNINIVFAANSADQAAIAVTFMLSPLWLSTEPGMPGS